MEAQETYSVIEAARYLGLSDGNTKVIYDAIREKQLDAWKSGKLGNAWIISKAGLDRYKTSLEKKRVNGAPLSSQQVTEVHPPPMVEPVKQLEPPKEVKKHDDGPLLQHVLTSVFSFLSQHSFPVGLRSLEEVDAHLRLWVVKTPETNLSVVASGDEVTVLSQEYQARLEARVEKLEQELRSKEKILATLRGKPKEVVLHEYSQPLIVVIEPRTEGYVARCEVFPFAGSGESEEDALAAFRRVLWGYTKWLRLHLEKLSPELKTQFELLKELLVEE